MIKEERLTNSYEMKQIEICNPNLIGIGKEYKRLYEYENTNLSPQEVEQLKKENAELKAKLENAIVPKFNFGDTIFAVVTYIDDPKDKTVIESGIVQKIECDKNQIKYWCDNGRIYWEDECEKLFATEQEAQQKLKELEEK